MGIRDRLYKRGMDVAQAVSTAKSGASSGGKKAYREMRTAKKISAGAKYSPVSGSRRGMHPMRGMMGGTRMKAPVIPRPGNRALAGARMGLPPSPTRVAARRGIGKAAGLDMPMLTGKQTNRARKVTKLALGAGGLGAAGYAINNNRLNSAKNAGLPTTGAGMYGTTSTNPMTPKGY